MQERLNRDEWRKSLWKILTNPTFEVVAVLLVVLLAAWVIVQTESLSHVPAVPVLQGNM
jgi:ABC-type nickel/cobalt efflux system permease component RcnA